MITAIRKSQMKNLLRTFAASSHCSCISSVLSFSLTFSARILTARDSATGRSDFFFGIVAKWTKKEKVKKRFVRYNKGYRFVERSQWKVRNRYLRFRITPTWKNCTQNTDYAHSTAVRTQESCQCMAAFVGRNYKGERDLGKYEWSRGKKQGRDGNKAFVRPPPHTTTAVAMQVAFYILETENTGKSMS